MRGLVLVLVVSTGCDLVFAPAPVAGTPDGAVDAAAVDAGVDAALGPFTTPIRVDPGIVTPTGVYVTDPSLDEAETQLAFVRVVTAGNVIDVLIGHATPDPAVWINAAVTPFSLAMRDEQNAKLAPDAKLMWISIATGVDPTEIEAWRRDQPEATSWDDASIDHVVGLNTTDNDRPGTPTRDLGHMVIHRTAGAGMTQLFEYERAGGTGAWHPMPGTLDAINPIGSVTNAHLSVDGRELVFAAAIPGGTLDLYRAHRAALGLAFDPPTKIDEISAPNANDGDPWLSVDGRRLWFSRSGGTLPVAEWGIYYSSRQ